jgi:hypothetical protein
MAATCLQVSAVLLFYYSNSHDRKTFFYRHAGLFADATDSAWRAASTPLKSEVLPAVTHFAYPPPLAACRANQVQALFVSPDYLRSRRSRLAGDQR